MLHFFIPENLKKILENILENTGISCSNVDGHPVGMCREVAPLETSRNSFLTAVAGLQSTRCNVLKTNS